MGNFCGRRGIFLAAPALKNVAAVDSFTADVARLARRAEHFVDACIVRLQFVVSDAPVANRMPLGQSVRTVFLRSPRKQLKTIRQEARNLGVPVLAGAA